MLIRDPKASMYVTEERFAFRGRELVRRGVIAAVRIEEYDRQIVLPHENTRQEWVLDRVRLMDVAKFNYSPLLVLFRDDLRSTVGSILRDVAKREPTDRAAPSDMPELHVWRLNHPEAIETLADAFSGNQLFIADGHHRYEAALRFQSRIRSQREVNTDESLNYRMMMLVAIDEPGLLTRGYHRTIRNASQEELSALKSALRQHAELTPAHYDGPRAVQRFAQDLARMPRSEFVLGVYGLEPQTFHLARIPGPKAAANELENSEYFRLHDLIIRPVASPEREAEIVDFSYEPQWAVDAVDSRRAQIAFIMRPMPMDQFTAIVTRGWRLPPKATNFHPKPSAGSVIQALEGAL